MIARHAVLVAVLLASCVEPKDREPVARAAAASDLGCDATQLTVRDRGARLFEVTGCGKTVSYRIICKLTVGSCYALKQ